MERQYKDSGVEWIGKIPETWGTCKVSQLYNVQLGKMLQPNQITDTDTYENYLCAANVGQNALKFFPLRQMWIQKKERDIYSLSKGDLIVVEGGDVASCDIIKDNVNNLFFQNALHRVRAKKGYTVDYLRYVLMTAKAVGYIDLICNKATISHFTKEKFENLVIPISHISEQQRIADYLDEKCGEIDSLIGLQEQMIKKLKAYKQSVITEAVTKGLNPNAKLVPSDIDWIGEIPEAWSKDKVIRCFSKIGSGTTPKSTDDNLFQGDINWLQSGDINGGDLFEASKHISKETLSSYSALSVYQAPFIIIAMYGASVGNISISHIDACVNQACCVMSGCKLDFNYAFFALKSAKPYLIYRAEGGGQPNISQDKIKTLWIPIPPLTEQQAIASYLDEKCADIDRLIGLKQRKIEKLKDYKKSVIYEAVTGKTIIE